MSDLASSNPETPMMTTEEARVEKRRAKWAATGACIGGVALGLGAGVFVATNLDMNSLIDTLAGVAAGTAAGSPFIVLGLEWVDTADARLETAQDVTQPEPASSI